MTLFLYNKFTHCGEVLLKILIDSAHLNDIENRFTVSIYNYTLKYLLAS